MFTVTKGRFGVLCGGPALGHGDLCGGAALGHGEGAQGAARVAASNPSPNPNPTRTTLRPRSLPAPSPPPLPPLNSHHSQASLPLQLRAQHLQLKHLLRVGSALGYQGYRS